MERRKQDTPIIVIIRIEQLFPLDKEYIKEPYRKVYTKELFWVQEEPENMGIWTFILSELRSFGIDVIARESSKAALNAHWFK